jgi:hypothetical protein
MCCNTVSRQARATGMTNEVIKHASSKRRGIRCTFNGRLHIWALKLKTDSGPVAIIKNMRTKLAPNQRTQSMPGTQLNQSQAEQFVT